MDGYDHDAEEKYWHEHDEMLARRRAEFGAPDFGPNYELMLNDKDDVLEPLYSECEEQIAAAIKKRDPALIGVIVMAAHDAYCERAYWRTERGASEEQLAQMPTARQAAALAIITYLSGKQ